MRDAIAKAAQATGVDFDYLLAPAKIESSLNPSARAATSSAAGLYQFTSGTWTATLGRHGAAHGMGWVNDALSTPTGRAQVMAMRYDPQVSALMAGHLAADNRADLTARLGREPDASELYLAHFLGSAGAGKFLEALAADSTQSAVALLPKAAAANRGIFFAGGAPRSVGGVMALIRDKVQGAMEGAGAPTGAANWADPRIAYQTPGLDAQAGPLAREFHAGQAAAPQVAPQPPAARSMSETLASAFGGASASVPENVRAAYAKLTRLGL
ncbi:transglycosylase [Novosphingobium guangzhouense]|uniref:Transglycosylase n=1 Tax=Novosphingobium guangzhouense TaxID=1850347 RepID=A0A2K2FVA1_9SPHN|nr:transglycosylase [Novosphingobium guangzhouense]